MATWHSGQQLEQNPVSPAKINIAEYQLIPQKFHTLRSCSKNKTPNASTKNATSLEHLSHRHILSPLEQPILTLFKNFTLYPIAPSVVLR